MVLKRSKYGANTGSTFRKSSWVSAKMSPVSFLEVRLLRRTPLSEDSDPKRIWLNDKGLTQRRENSLNQKPHHIDFSLNKDKRWNLYDEVASQVLKYKHSTSSTSMNEMKRNSKRKQKRIAKEKGNMIKDETVGVILKPGEWLPLTKRWYSEFTKSIVDSNGAQENFDNSWRSTGKCLQDYDKTYVFREGFPSKTFPKVSAKMPKFSVPKKHVYPRQKTNKQLQYSMQMDITNSMNEELFDEELELDDYAPVQNETSYSRENRYYKLTDFSKSGKEAPRFKKVSHCYSKATKMDKYDFSKPHIQTIERTEQITDAIFVNSVNDFEKKLGGVDEDFQIFTIKVKNSSILPENLKEKFSLGYIEGKCQPRCFAIFNVNGSSQKLLFETLNSQGDYTELSVKILSSKFGGDFLFSIASREIVDFNVLADIAFHVNPCHKPLPSTKTLSSSKCMSHYNAMKRFIKTQPIEDVLLENIANKEIPNVERFPINQHGYEEICVVCLEVSPMTSLSCGHSFCNNFGKPI